MEHSKPEDDDKFDLFGPPTGQKAGKGKGKETLAGAAGEVADSKPDVAIANVAGAETQVKGSFPKSDSIQNAGGSVLQTTAGTGSFPKSDTIASNYHSASSQISSAPQSISAKVQGTSSTTSKDAIKGSEAYHHVELYETVGEMFSAAVESLYGKIFGVNREQAPAANSQTESHPGSIELYEKTGEMFVAALESLQGKIASGEPTTIALLFSLVVLPIYYFSSWRRRPVVLERRDSIYVERLTHE
jgi:hypothetical protein